MVVFDKLDAALHLFPELQVAVDGRCDDEIGPKAARKGPARVVVEGRRTGLRRRS